MPARRARERRGKRHGSELQISVGSAGPALCGIGCGGGPLALAPACCRRGRPMSLILLRTAVRAGTQRTCNLFVTHKGQWHIGPKCIDPSPHARTDGNCPNYGGRVAQDDRGWRVTLGVDAASTAGPSADSGQALEASATKSGHYFTLKNGEPLCACW